MARKRKGSKKKSGRRRMSGTSQGSGFIGPLGTAGGAVLGTYLINGPLETQSWSEWAMIGAGIIGPRFLKSPIANAIGNGLVAAGIISFAQNAKAINGMDKVYVGSAAGGGPIQSLAGGRRRMAGPGTPAQAARRAAAGQRRVVLGSMGPIQAVAGGCM